jgi:hypothetical protein
MSGRSRRALAAANAYEPPEPIPVIIPIPPQNIIHVLLIQTNRLMQFAQLIVGMIKAQ